MGVFSSLGVEAIAPILNSYFYCDCRNAFSPNRVKVAIAKS
ncbi:hypothetical protein [Nostoc sp. UCD120]|nr:hypothetical protein [Nostoc sp. UCD120]